MKDLRNGPAQGNRFILGLSLYGSAGEREKLTPSIQCNEYHRNFYKLLKVNKIIATLHKIH